MNTVALIIGWIVIGLAMLWVALACLYAIIIFAAHLRFRKDMALVSQSNAIWRAWNIGYITEEDIRNTQDIDKMTFVELRNFHH